MTQRQVTPTDKRMNKNDIPVLQFLDGDLLLATNAVILRNEGIIERAIVDVLERTFKQEQHLIFEPMKGGRPYLFRCLVVKPKEGAAPLRVTHHNVMDDRQTHFLSSLSHENKTKIKSVSSHPDEIAYFTGNQTHFAFVRQNILCVRHVALRQKQIWTMIPRTCRGRNIYETLDGRHKNWNITVLAIRTT
jgi:hypothetical protein